LEGVITEDEIERTLKECEVTILNSELLEDEKMKIRNEKTYERILRNGMPIGSVITPKGVCDILQEIRKYPRSCRAPEEFLFIKTPQGAIAPITAKMVRYWQSQDDFTVKVFDYSVKAEKMGLVIS
jgi:hypothetical protein